MPPASPPVFSYIQPEENSGYLLWQTSMRWHLLMNQRLRTLNLTLTQFSLLASLYWLGQQGEYVTQQRVADYAQVDKMMTSKILQALERKGIISRLAHPLDGRGKHLRLTEAGEALLRQAYSLVQEVDASFFGPIQAESSLFNRLMQQLWAASAATDRRP